METTIDDLDGFLDVFVRGPFTIMKQAMPSLIANKGFFFICFQRDFYQTFSQKIHKLVQLCFLFAGCVVIVAGIVDLLPVSIQRLFII